MTPADDERLNPYLASAGRRAYQESYREHVVAAQRWRIMGMLALIVAGGAVTGMVMIARVSAAEMTDSPK